MELRPYLETLIGGGDLDTQSAYDIGVGIAKGAVDASQLAALLALLAARGESAAVVTGFARALRGAMVRVELPPALAGRPVLDIVGTGGDGLNSVNISTPAAVLAAACGALVAKHGSVSVSSKSGAADVLLALGVPHVPPAFVGECVASAGVAFCFAPLFHPALAAALPVRRALKVRTVFNILGPLLNPAGATRSVLGVYSPRLLRVFGEAMRDLGSQRALIVHSCGSDELTPVGPTQFIELTEDGALVEGVLDPAEWGVPRCTFADLEGGDPAHNAALLRRVLGGGPAAAGPVGHAIALNAGAGLYVCGLAESVGAGYAAAFAALQEGKALRTLTNWATVSQALARGGGTAAE